MDKKYLSQQPVDDFGLENSDLKFSVVLSTDTDTSMTVPDSSKRYKALVKVSQNAADNVWMAVNTAAVVPSSNSFGTTDSELISTIGTCREVLKGDVLHFKTDSTTAEVSVVLYAND